MRDEFIDIKERMKERVVRHKIIESDNYSLELLEKKRRKEKELRERHVAEIKRQKLMEQRRKDNLGKLRKNYEQVHKFHNLVDIRE